MMYSLYTPAKTEHSTFYTKVMIANFERVSLTWISMNTAPTPSCRMLEPVSWAVEAVLVSAPVPAACSMQPPVRITSESHCLALRGRLNRICNTKGTYHYHIS